MMHPFVKETLEKINNQKKDLDTAKRLLYHYRVDNDGGYNIIINMIEEYIREMEVTIKAHDKCVEYAMITNPHLFYMKER
jgi:hypothetical protein